MDSSPLPSAQIEEQLAKVLSSSAFGRAERSSALLKYVVDQVLQGNADRLKEYTIGAIALGRGDDFDPRTDPVVRAEASRLRNRLEQYYEGEGRSDSVLISLPKGGYVPNFEWRRIEAPTSTIRPRAIVPWGIAGMALVAAMMAFVYRQNSPSQTSNPVQRFEVELKSDGLLSSQVSNDIAISPDGQRIAYVSRIGDGVAHLNTRRLDQPNAVKLTDTEGARIPFFSADGRWLGFQANGKLKKISVDGGASVVLCETVDLFGASWSEGDTIIAAIGPRNVLSRLSANGGIPEPVIQAAEDSVQLRWPQILPGDRFVLYSVGTGAGADRSRVEVQSIRGGDRQVLVEGGTFGKYLGSGHLLYVNQGTMFAVAFDVNTLKVAGAAIPVLDDISYSSQFGYAQLDVSRTGTLVYRRGAESAPSTIHWIDRKGNVTPFLDKPGNYSWMRLSPDNKQLAVTKIESAAKNVVLYDSVSKNSKALTTVDGEYNGYVWLGSKLIFGNFDGIYWTDTARPSTPKILTTEKKVHVPWSLTPAADRLAYYDRTSETGFNLWTVPIETQGEAITLGKHEPYLNSTDLEFYPSFSPDGRWIAYSSTESGTNEVYVRRFPDTGYKVKLSVGGGSQLRWSPNNREVLYRTFERQVMAVRYRIEGDRFIAERPVAWSSHRLANAGIAPNYDISSDGERIVAALSAATQEPQSANHATFILNFHEAVRRKFADGGATAK